MANAAERTSSVFGAGLVLMRPSNLLEPGIGATGRYQEAMKSMFGVCEAVASGVRPDREFATPHLNYRIGAM
jgi:hypothetical protein